MRPEVCLAHAWVLAAKRWPRGHEEILALQVRQRAYQAVVDQPGIHVSEVARLLSISPNHARYHLATLARAGLVAGQVDGGFLRYVARSHDRGLPRDVVAARDKQIMGALRRERPLHVAIVLLSDGPLPLKDIAARVGKSRATVHFHLGGLVKRGLVRTEGEGVGRRYGLADPAELTAFLVRFPPKVDLIGSFVALWEGLALPKKGRPSTAPGPFEQEPGEDADRSVPSAPRAWRPKIKSLGLA